MKKNLLILISSLQCCLKLSAQNFNTTDVEIYPVGVNVNNAMTENSVFISPINPDIIVSANNSNDVNIIPNSNLGVFTSMDRGLTWTGNFFFQTDATADPYCSIDTYGRIYVSYISLNGASEIRLRYSDDNGTTWSLPITIAASPNIDKPHFYIDNRPNRTHDLMLCAFKENSTQTIQITKSVDRGLTWDTPIDLCTGLGGVHHQGANIAIGPEGNLYVAWAIYDIFTAVHRDETGLGFASSIDGGSTWVNSRINYNTEPQGSPPIYIDLPIKGIRTGNSLIGFQQKAGQRHSSWPSIAVNQQNGTLYLSWVNIGLPPPTGSNLGDPDICFIKSSNSGLTWSDAVKINHDNLSGIDQWQPYLACDEYTGMIGAVYYDSRDFPSNNDFYTYLSLSSDEGQTWSDHKIGDVPGTPLNPIYGHDYNGLDMFNGLITPVWSDKRTGYASTFIQPCQVDCANDLYLCGPVTPYYKIEKASNTITAPATGCTYDIQTGAKIKLKSVNFVKLQNGFHASAGSEFQASIVNNCDVSTVFRKVSNSAIAPQKPIDVENQEELTLLSFPNPVTSELAISIKSIGDTKITVQLLDNYGRLVISLIDKFPLNANYNTTLHFNLNSLNINSGFYLVKAITADKIALNKICYIKK